MWDAHSTSLQDEKKLLQPPNVRLHETPPLEEQAVNTPDIRNPGFIGAGTSPKHAVSSVRLLTSGPKVQAREFVVEVGQRIQWHSHSKITDWCFCLEGVVVFEAADPDSKTSRQQSLQPGEHCVIPAGITHRLRAGSTDSCRYLLVQAGDKYDFNEATDAWLPS